MEKQVFSLVSPLVRRNAAHAIANAPEGYMARIEPPKKSRDQEELYHALFGEIAKTKTFMDRKWDTETWKRLLVDAFARIKAAEGEPIQGYGSMVPNLDHTGFVQLGIQTRRFTKKQASEFIEYLHAWMEDSEVAA